MGRREQTTHELRVAAFEEWLEAGPRAMSHRSVARRACYSEAAVHQRWANRRALLDDVVDGSVAPRLDALVQSVPADCDVEQWLDLMVGTEERRRTVQSLAELMFAARDDQRYAPMATDFVRRLLESVPVADLADPLQQGSRWWLVGHVLGAAMLHRCGYPPPDHHDALARVLATGALDERAVRNTPPPPSQPLLTPLPRHEPTDDVERAILEASRSSVVRAGVDELTVRAVAAEAGVTTGALYRRWESRSGLLTTLIAQEGLGDRYRWLPQLIAGNDGGLDSAVGTARKVWSDPESRDLLLELAVAAHTDGAVCTRLAAQVAAVVEARLIELRDADELQQLTGWMTPEEITWLLQTPPVGLRLLSAVEIEPTDDEYAAIIATFAEAMTGVPAAALLGTRDSLHPSA